MKKTGSWPTCPTHGNDLVWSGFGHYCVNCVIEAAVEREAAR